MKYFLITFFAVVAVVAFTTTYPTAAVMIGGVAVIVGGIVLFKRLTF